MVGDSSLQNRTYPAAQRIVDEITDRVARFLRHGGFPEEDAQNAVKAAMERNLAALSPGTAGSGL